MQSSETKNPEYIISRFCVVGINFRQASASARSLFSITVANRPALLADANEKGFRSLFALSTCNRSELYGFCASDTDMTELFIRHTKGTADIFYQYGFVKRGYEAFDYFFKVVSGIHSQITGDYEIAGQLKCAVAQSRKQALIGPLMDRTINFALQASKAVKSSTSLSHGTVSVSYAIIESLFRIKDIQEKSLLLIGAGALGRNVARNIKHYIKPSSFNIMNRSDERAKELAKEAVAEYKPFTGLSVAVAGADIIIVCTEAAEYILNTEHFTGNKPVYLFDLSVPENIHPAVKNIAGITLSGIDEISGVMNQNLARRQEEIPRANAIIEKHLVEFYEWIALYRHVPVINDIKTKLYSLGDNEYTVGDTVNKAAVNRRVNKTVGVLAMNLRDKNEKGCQYINAINDFLNDAHNI